MKTIWVVQYNDGTADVFDEDQGPPSWPYVDAFEAKERIAELQAQNLDMMGLLRDICDNSTDAQVKFVCKEMILKYGGDV